jgi:hypothetical protein
VGEPQTFRFDDCGSLNRWMQPAIKDLEYEIAGNIYETEAGWQCGKCEQEKMAATGLSGHEIIPNHFRTCPKRDVP